MLGLLAADLLRGAVDDVRGCGVLGVLVTDLLLGAGGAGWTGAGTATRRGGGLGVDGVSSSSTLQSISTLARF
ncbi:MAG: hypothetical protein HY246_10595 [Proteobacteria bacterium]|nr:hypothetical protein [Pseudomonadota bacterium]